MLIFFLYQVLLKLNHASSKVFWLNFLFIPTNFHEQCTWVQIQISWMEKFVQKGSEITAPVPMAPPGMTGLGGFEVPLPKGCILRSDASALNVGVLHLVPSLEVFPLLADPKMYVKLHTRFAQQLQLDKFHVPVK